ncbi:Aspartate 1-decarboxylase PanD [Methanonatronarchaeum thermophilum]|uniref:Aspartate 1-decarboxylase n=1 Tax=Methanonatronarchaeum thermophilum TaxID=1927129 RepID=A0A1Y3GE67_9EURY|nr:aspartate 1-decarboxylase [Methanonatronarchaeum thermophilum]OUJ18593.1 Aspartate 1-decarboxylase PanD [Methanonatronarchaeum thermophilum]
MRTVLKSKIHRATVTEADVEYIGSITIDSELLDHADLWPNERVLVVSNTSGARLETYTIPGEPGSGEICINGAAANKINVGENITIMSFISTKKQIEPTVVSVDNENKFKAYL